MDTELSPKEALAAWLTDALRALRAADDYISTRDAAMAQLLVLQRKLSKRREAGTAVMVAVLLIVTNGIPLMLFMMLLPNTALFIIVRVGLAAACVGLAIPMFKMVRRSLRPPEAKRAEQIEKRLKELEAGWAVFRTTETAAMDAVRALPKVYRRPEPIDIMMGYVQKGWADNWESLTVLYEDRNPSHTHDQDPQTAEGFAKEFWWQQAWKEDDPPEQEGA